MLKKYKKNFFILLFTILITIGCSNKLNDINTKNVKKGINFYLIF